MQVIQQAKNLCQNSQYGPGAIAFEFAQVHSLRGTRHACFTLSLSLAPYTRTSTFLAVCAGGQGHQSSAIPGTAGQ